MAAKRKQPSDVATSLSTLKGVLLHLILRPTFCSLPSFSRRDAQAKLLVLVRIDLFVTLKPLLHTSLPLTRATSDLLRVLHTIAREAAQLGALAARRPSADAGGPAGLAAEDKDWLDAEGVFVWNRSGEWKSVERGEREMAGRDEVLGACT